MSSTIRELARRVSDLSTKLEGAALAELLTETRDLFDALKAAEAEHVTLAIEDDGFPFEGVQADLAECRTSFARVVRQLSEAHRSALSDEMQSTLDELAFLAERAPLTTATDVKAIRAARPANLHPLST